MKRASSFISLKHYLLFQTFTFILFAVLWATSSSAHELRPTIVGATLHEDGRLDVQAKVNLEALVAGISADHEDTKQSEQSAYYDTLRAESPEALASLASQKQAALAAGLRFLADDQAVALNVVSIDIPAVGDVAVARTSTLNFSAELPNGVTALQWQADAQFGETVLRLSRFGEDKPFFSSFYAVSEQSTPIVLADPNVQSSAVSFVKYVVIGFEHIIPKGLDHILFVIGLFLLSPRLRPLVWQITSFTVAHSVTLALGIYGIVTISPAIVEPLIAASIAFIAIENLFTNKLQRWRPFVVFSFGLLHGLGFASVLSDVGLPAGQFAVSLVAFNVGVELGHLVVLAGCFLAVGFWFRNRSWYRQAITMPLSVMVAFVAVFWFVERIGLV